MNKTSRRKMCLVASALMLPSLTPLLAQAQTPPANKNAVVKATSTPSSTSGSTSINCPTNAKEGVDYTVVAGNFDQRVSKKSGKDSVVEFFNYACIHCANFYPLIKQAQKDAQSAGSNLEFVYIPVSFRPDWEVGSRLYLALETLGLGSQENHQKVFTAIHVEKKKLLTNQAELTEFLKKIEPNKYTDILKTMTSFSVESKLKQSKSISDAYQVESTPLVFIDKAKSPQLLKISPEVTKTLYAMSVSIKMFIPDSCRK